jgi:hypothetical protein
MICPICKEFEMRPRDAVLGRCVSCWEKDRRFEGWMARVDAILEERVGTASSDLDDFLWRDHYDAGEEPGETVETFLEEGLE